MASATNSNNNMIDDSFSSYLAYIRQSFSNELANPSSRRPSFQTKPPPPPPPKRSLDESRELDVFRAEKYFSGTLDVQDYSYQLTACSEGKKDKCSKTTRSRSSTCSEASAHSHSVLLRDRRHAQQQLSAARCGSFLDVFRCSCSKKNAIKVDEDSVISYYSSNDNTRLPNSSRRRPQRYSLQSEPSSDLFEIDNLAYESSETSIELSVPAASAANLSAVASERAASPTLNGTRH